MKYNHLSQNERYQIFALMKAGLFDLVRQEWSLEQVAGTMNISHETVYRHVYADKDLGGNLFMHLPS